MRWPAATRATACAWALLLAATAHGATKPQYGGVLRVELRAASVNLNPQRWKAGALDYGTQERLAELVLERLVALDNYGRFQPQLATEWKHDSNGNRWQFTLRQGVKFSDGTALTPDDVARALQTTLPAGMQVSASPSGVVVQTAAGAGDLLEILASGANFIFREDGKGTLLGTGPFVLESTPAGKAAAALKSRSDSDTTSSQRLRFRSNDSCWSGRPYLDAIEVTLGVPPLRALVDLQLGKTDVAELSEDTARRAQQSNVKLWVSAPLTLYAVKFTALAKTDKERALRQALELSQDRNAMARVLLQKQAEAAASFLPQWLSGYAFLLEMESNVEVAKEVRAGLPAGMPGIAQPLRISVDTGNDLAKLVAERVVVNARAAGFTLQLASKPAGRPAGEGVAVSAPKAEPDALIIAWRYSSLSPREELQELASAARREGSTAQVPADVEARYAWEKRMIDEKNILPLVAVPDFAALDGKVRNWSAAPWGEWRLAEVWLERGESPANGNDAAKGPVGAKP